MNSKQLVFAFLVFCCVSPILAAAGTLKTISATTDDDNGDKSIITSDEAQKPSPKICQVKVQVKVLGAVNGTIYTVQLDDLFPQSKQAVFNQTEIDNGDNNVAFMFQFRKGGDSCPDKDSTVLGNVNTYGFAAYINSLTKPNKVWVEIP